MDFAEAHDVFCQPRTGAVADLPSSTPARRLRDAFEPLAMVNVWSDAAAEQLAAAGLNFLTGYVGGRGSVLGDAEGTVVAATFAVFEPGLIASLWDQAREVAPVSRHRELRVSVAREAMNAALADVPAAEIDGVVDPLRAALEGADLAGKPLFAGLRALPWPGDAPTRLWHAASLLREHRGDVHLAACNAAGVDGLEANMLTELWVGFELNEYTGTRAWSEEATNAAIARLEGRGLIAGGTLTDEGRRVRTAIEDATDLAQQPIVDALGGALDPTVKAAGTWAEAVVARGWFPPDPYKRAAG